MGCSQSIRSKTTSCISSTVACTRSTLFSGFQSPRAAYIPMASINETLVDTPSSTPNGSTNGLAKSNSNVALNGSNNIDLAELSDTIAHYGSSVSTAWLELDRYGIWRPSQPIQGSSFSPVIGYLQKDPWLFAWGNPIVSDPAALPAVADQFIQWVESQDRRLVWCCVNPDLEEILAGKGWATVSCIEEDVVDPEHVLEMTSDESKGKEGQALVKDLKKNLRRAEKAHVEITEIKADQWTDEMRQEVDEGVEEWKRSRSGLQVASTSFQPWLDFEHRRYWVARAEGKAVGVLILSPIHPSNYVIKNAVSFPKAPKGTSEALIHTALRAIHEETAEQGHGNVSITFSVSASRDLKPVKNLSGWKFTWLNKTYSKVSDYTGLLKRGDFRSKFDSTHEHMYVCYPSEDGFGMDGVEALLKVLRK